MKHLCKDNTGITLIELMVGISVVGIMIGVAIPSFSGWMSHFRLRNAAIDIASDFRLARSLAARDHAPHRISFLSNSEYSLHIIINGIPSEIYKKDLKDKYRGVVEIVSIKDSSDSSIDIDEFIFSTNGIVEGEPGTPIPPYNITLERKDDYSESLNISVSMSGNITID